MAGNQPPHDGLGDDFLEQILAVQPGYGRASTGGGGGGEMVGSTLPMIMGLQLGSSHVNSVTGLLRSNNHSNNSNNNSGHMGILPLGLNLEDHSFLRQHDQVGGGGSGLDCNNANTNNVSSSNSSSTTSGINERDSLHMTSLFPALGHLQIQPIHGPTPPPPPAPPQLHQPFQSQPTPGVVSAVSHPPIIRPRVRARRGQATDPHSIAERLRRERIAERMKALQELVPTTNKTDRAAILDEIVDYVKFLRLQVKVLSMSRLGAAGAVAQLVADIPMSSIEGEGIEGGANQQPWEKWSNDGTEQQVAKLMEEDIGAAMQFLQSKALCIMPISLASAIFRTNQPDQQSLVNPESNVPP